MTTHILSQSFLANLSYEGYVFKRCFICENSVNYRKRYPKTNCGPYKRTTMIIPQIPQDINSVLSDKIRFVGSASARPRNTSRRYMTTINSTMGTV
jgi:hypothetical protein